MKGQKDKERKMVGLNDRTTDEEWERKKKKE